MKLENKVVIVTGASSGLGKELALQLAKRGNTVVLASRNAFRIHELEKSITEQGGKALAVPTDVSKRFQVEYVVERTIREFGRLDIFISNAGITHPSDLAMTIREPDARNVMDVNFMGGVYATWASVPAFEQSGGGLLVFVSSIVGKRGIPKNSFYCASKFALNGFAESIRPELKKKNIRVLLMCPGGIDTEFFNNNGRSQARNFPLHTPQKIAGLVLRACERETREDLLTIDAKLLHYANIMAPSISDWAIARNKGV